MIAKLRRMCDELYGGDEDWHEHSIFMQCSSFSKPTDRLTGLFGNHAEYTAVDSVSVITVRVIIRVTARHASACYKYVEMLMKSRSPFDSGCAFTELLESR